MKNFSQEDEKLWFKIANLLKEKASPILIQFIENLQQLVERSQRKFQVPTRKMAEEAVFGKRQLPCYKCKKNTNNQCQGCQLHFHLKCLKRKKIC